jgi:hypothetical protein
MDSIGMRDVLIDFLFNRVWMVGESTGYPGIGRYIYI